MKDDVALVFVVLAVVGICVFTGLLTHQSHLKLLQDRVEIACLQAGYNPGSCKQIVAGNH